MNIHERPDPYRIYKQQAKLTFALKNATKNQKQKHK